VSEIKEYVKRLKEINIQQVLRACSALRSVAYSDDGSGLLLRETPQRDRHSPC
jgi:hypothetical protein